MGAVAAIILVIICVVSSRSDFAYAVVIGIMYLIAFVLLMVGLVNGVWQMIPGSFFAVLFPEIIVYNFVDMDNHKRKGIIGAIVNWVRSNKAYKILANIDDAFDEITETHKQNMERNNPTTFDELDKFYGWRVPRTSDEFIEHFTTDACICCSYEVKQFFAIEAKERLYLSDYYSINGYPYEAIKLLIEDTNSEYYDTLVHVESKGIWFYAIIEIALERAKPVIKERIKYAEKKYDITLPYTPLDFVKDYARIKASANICCVKNQEYAEIAMADLNSPFYPDSPYYEDGEQVYDDKELFYETCLKWSEDRENEKERIRKEKWLKEQEKLKEEALERAINNYGKFTND